MNTEYLTIYVIPELLKVTEKAIKEWNKALKGRAEFIIINQGDPRALRTPDITITYGITDRSTDPTRIAQATPATIRGSDMIQVKRWALVLDSRVKWAVSGWARFWNLDNNNALSAVLHELGHTLGFPHSHTNHHVMNSTLGTSYISAEEGELLREFWDIHQGGF